MGGEGPFALRIRPGCRADWKMHLGAILPSEEEGKASVYQVRLFYQEIEEKKPSH